MHIVSHVSGELREDKGPFDAFRSVFPAGTVSGAPKMYCTRLLCFSLFQIYRSAMKLIYQLEGAKRGVYAGAVGMSR